MGHSKKRIKGNENAHIKTIPNNDGSTDGLNIVWDFSLASNDGMFRLSSEREDMDIKSLLDNIIAFSRRTWQDIRKDVHGKDGKSKHHHVSFDDLTPEGKEAYRKRFSSEDENSDSVFSMRFQGKVRIIGFRDGQKFKAVWYDPKHQFVSCKN